MWFTEKRVRYWVINATRQACDINTEDGGSGSGSGSGSNDTGAAIKAEIKEWMKKEEGLYKASTVATEVNPWLQYTNCITIAFRALNAFFGGRLGSGTGRM